MKTIWKFPLTITPNQELEMPRGAQPLSVDVQNISVEGDGGLMLWVLVDPQAPKVTRRVNVFGTGDPVAERPGEFIGSVMLAGGIMVWHVFVAPEFHPGL